MRDRRFHLLISLMIGLCCGAVASTVQADKIVIEQRKSAKLITQKFKKIK